MRRLVLYLSLLLTSACASSRYHSDRNDPGFHQASPMKALAYSSHAHEPYAGGEESAMAGLVLSALSLAVNPDYYKDDFITGRCLCRSSEEGDFEIPCMNLTVALVDDRGEETGRVYTSDGEFVFSADPKRTYRLRVHSERYQLAAAPKWVTAGDEISLRLIKK